MLLSYFFQHPGDVRSVCQIVGKTGKLRARGRNMQIKVVQQQFFCYVNVYYKMNFLIYSSTKTIYMLKINIFNKYSPRVNTSGIFPAGDDSNSNPWDMHLLVRVARLDWYFPVVCPQRSFFQHFAHCIHYPQYFLFILFNRYGQKVTNRRN